MKIFNLALLLSTLCFVNCNKDSEPSTIFDSDICLVLIDGSFQETDLSIKPEFINGGIEGFLDSLYLKLKYPAEARENGFEGKCIVEYEITQTGTVENINITQDPGGGIGNAVNEWINCITDGITFNPGMIDNKKVRVKKGLEINFKLEG